MNSDPKSPINAEKNKKDCTRIEAFSDGVFSIAITLLVLDIIAVKHPANGESLINSFIDQWQTFLAFIIGFFTILICWINHHFLFTYIIRFDGKMIWINGFLLLLVTFIPFPTSILAEHLQQEDHTAIAIYGFTFFLMAVLLDRLWTYATKHHFLVPDEDDSFFHGIKMTYRYSILLTFGAFLIGFVSITANIIIVTILFLVYAFPAEFAHRLQKFYLKRQT